MPNIKITVRNKIAENASRTEYVCGNSDFVIDFDFDAEWDAYEGKTARFIYSGGYQDIVFQGNQCAVPVISNTHTILCGVYAGDLHTTTPALIPARKGILCGDPPPADPPPDVYAQLMELINSMSEVDPEAIAAAVAEYMAENPVEAVRYDTPQELTEEQQKQARENIEAMQATTVDYWENGGVNDVMWAILNKRNRWDFLVCRDVGCAVSNANRPLMIYAPGFNQFGEGSVYAIDRLGAVYCASCTLGHSLPKPSVYSEPNRILSVNMQSGGDIETSFYITITKKDDGSYESDLGIGHAYHRWSAGDSVYARFGDEIAPLTKMEVTRNPPGHNLVGCFTLPPIFFEASVIFRKIEIAGYDRSSVETVTLTETEVPTVSSVKALAEDVGNNFLAYNFDQPLTDEQRLQATRNMGVRTPRWIRLLGDGSNENPFTLDQDISEVKEYVGLWLDGSADLELMWLHDVNSDWFQTLYIVDITGSDIVFANAQWQVILTITESGTDYTITTKQIPSIPSSTTEDAGKFLRVGEDGAAAWETGGDWKLHTEQTLAEDVVMWELTLPTEWKRLYILLAAGDKPICRNPSTAAKQTYCVTAVVAANLNSNAKSHYVYMQTNPVWCVVDRMGDHNFTSVVSCYATAGNSGFTPATQGVKIQSDPDPDFGHIVVHHWGNGSTNVISAGTKIKIMYVE